MCYIAATVMRRMAFSSGRQLFTSAPIDKHNYTALSMSSKTRTEPSRGRPGTMVTLVTRAGSAFLIGLDGVSLFSGLEKWHEDLLSVSCPVFIRRIRCF